MLYKRARNRIGHLGAGSILTLQVNYLKAMQSSHSIANKNVVSLYSNYIVVDTVCSSIFSFPGKGKNVYVCGCGCGETSIWALIKHNFLVVTFESWPEWFLIENIRGKKLWGLLWWHKSNGRAVEKWRKQNNMRKIEVWFLDKMYLNWWWETIKREKWISNLLMAELGRMWLKPHRSWPCHTGQSQTADLAYKPLGYALSLNTIQSLNSKETSGSVWGGKLLGYPRKLTHRKQENQEKTKVAMVTGG